MTSALMDDPKFVAKIQAIRNNPLELRNYLGQDQEIMQAFIVLSGMETMLRQEQMKVRQKCGT